VFVNLSFVMQLKTLRRQPNQRQLPIFASGNCLRPTTSAQMEATLADVPDTAKKTYPLHGTYPYFFPLGT
jgi:hypothetical protein